MELEKWIQKNQPLKKISKLEKYRNEINELISRSYTQNQVVEFLKDVYKIEVSRQSISAFLKNEHTIKNKKKEVKNTKTDNSKIDIADWLKK